MTHAQQEGLLRSFGRAVRDDSARALDLLRDIETTVAAVTWWEEHLLADARYAHSLTEQIQSGDPTAAIDPDDKIAFALEEAQGAVERLYQEFITKREAARHAPELTEEDGVVTAYTGAIAAAADLHNALNSLRWGVGEHDVDATPQATDHKFDTDELDALFAELRA